MPDVEITRTTWPKLIDIVREKTGLQIPIWQCVLIYYNVCLASLIPPDVSYLWNKYNVINGMRNETCKSYDGVTAIYADACRIIESEISKINKERKTKK